MLTKLSPVFEITHNDFNYAWQDTLDVVRKQGNQIAFGNVGEVKIARDVCATIILEGNAIEQIENHETHKDYPFDKRRLEEYCYQYTDEYLAEYELKSEKERFDYLYYERFKRPVNQLYTMRKNLKKQKETGITSNFCQATTWRSQEDGSFEKSSPCLQKIWLRWYEPDLVDVHMSWRSRDLYGAWPSNIIALTQMLNNEVIRPNGCKIVRIIDKCDSLHIYDRDLEAAKKVKYVPTFHGV